MPSGSIYSVGGFTCASYRPSFAVGRGRKERKIASASACGVKVVMITARSVKNVRCTYDNLGIGHGGRKVGREEINVLGKGKI